MIKKCDNNFGASLKFSLHAMCWPKFASISKLISTFCDVCYNQYGLWGHLVRPRFGAYAFRENFKSHLNAPLRELEASFMRIWIIHVYMK